AVGVEPDAASYARMPDPAGHDLMVPRLPPSCRDRGGTTRLRPVHICVTRLPPGSESPPAQEVEGMEGGLATDLVPAAGEPAPLHEGGRADPGQAKVDRPGGLAVLAGVRPGPSRQGDGEVGAGPGQHALGHGAGGGLADRADALEDLAGDAEPARLEFVRI